MQANKLRLLHESVRRYLRRGAWSHLEKLIAKTRDEELASVMHMMPEDDQKAVFNHLPDPERQANIITRMDYPFGKRVLSPLTPLDAATILREMAQDDAADILADLDPEQTTEILDILEGSESVEDLMRYGEDTAGGIMIPEFVSVEATDSAMEALAKLRQASDVEMVYYVYVVNQHGHLVGVLSLRKLVTAAPEKPVGDIMETDVISVTPETDQEEVARLVARYNFLSIPVVDDSNRLIGLVTVDDVIDVLREEATEDILKMAGAGEELAETAGVRRNVKVRFPWLLASCIGGLLGAAVMGTYHETIETHAVLAFYLPLILGMSGNVGTQAATVTVRAIALGHIGDLGNRWRVVRKELAIGTTMGVIYGLVVGGVAAVVATNVYYGLSVGLAFVAGMIVASTVGSAIPMLMSRLSFDPAVATGPFVTTSVDILGIVAYFGIASLLLQAFAV
ncbi:MAG: magnesium transporter [Myxococcota bacterium]